jgi:hypothetical protein
LIDVIWGEKLLRRRREKGGNVKEKDEGKMKAKGTINKKLPK